MTPEPANVIGPKPTSARMTFSIAVFARAKEFGGHGKSASSTGAGSISGRLVPAEEKRIPRRTCLKRQSPRRRLLYRTVPHERPRGSRRRCSGQQHYAIKPLRCCSRIVGRRGGAAGRWHIRGEIDPMIREQVLGELDTVGRTTH